MTPSLRATYRLQFHERFTFADAEALVPYLADLGISHLYASPIATAAPGSMHGYDVTDPTRINPELGGDAAFVRLAAALRDRGMGILLDIVPNHMAASTHNPFWLAMLEGGPSSDAARLFDVRWDDGRVLLPMLGEPLQATLEAGQLALRADPDIGRIVVTAYGEHQLPISLDSVAALLDEAAVGNPALMPLAAAARDPAPSLAVSPYAEALRALSPGACQALDVVLAEADFAALLDAQHWRLAWWRTAAHEINYRRFFNITELVGVRIEDPAAFELVHRLPLDLLRRGLIHGLRIDHIDGLADPAGYCRRLREAVGPDVPIFVEKILEPGEVLRAWPIDGTTGYERLNDINGLFVDVDGYRRLDADLRQRQLIVGTPSDRVAAAKRQVLDTSLKAEVDLLTALARSGLDEAMAARDLTDASIRDAVVALLVACPVYRTYATPDGHAPEDEAIWQAIGVSVKESENPLTVAAAELLLERLDRPETPSDREFLRRFQQVSGPAMAKGFEDTELYRYPALLSVNEVGSSLDHATRTADEIHARATARAEAGVGDLIPLATHDTKRGPGTRARLTALSRQAEHWLGFASETERQSKGFITEVDGIALPDALDRHFILQTLVSVWPIAADRMAPYLTKALREAKRHTSWEMPNDTYEAAAQSFVRSLIEAAEAAAFRQAMETLLAGISPAERIVRLGQVILQMTLPGTPDIYQGTELPDFSLVDPDNRRPVDWERRKVALAGEGGLGEADAERFLLTRQLLALRRRNPALAQGDYRPLTASGGAWTWFAFERRADGHAVRIIVPIRAPGAGLEAAAAFVSLPEPFGEGWRKLDGEPIAPGRAGFDVSANQPYLIAERGDR